MILGNLAKCVGVVWLERKVFRYGLAVLTNGIFPTGAKYYDARINASGADGIEQVQSSKYIYPKRCFRILPGDFWKTLGRQMKNIIRSNTRYSLHDLIAIHDTTCNEMKITGQIGEEPAQFLIQSIDR